MSLPGSGRTYEMECFGAIDELQSGERQDTVSVERGLEGEVETGEGFDRRQPGHLDRHPDAAVLARGQLFGEQGVDGLDGADLAALDAAQGDVVGELELKPSEVDLGLLARRRLEAHFVTDAPSRSYLAHVVTHYAVAAGKAALLDLTKQPACGEVRIGRKVLAQIRFEVIDDTRSWRPFLIGRRLQPFGDVGPDSLSVDADLPSDGADRQALAMQIQNHDEFPKFDHRVLLPARRRSLGDSARPPIIPGMPGTIGSHENWGNFKCHKWGELLRHSQGLDGGVPDHSTFSKNRHGRFRESDLLRKLFETVVARCMKEWWEARPSRST